MVDVPEYCKEEQRRCSLLHCPYGMEKFVDPQGCEKCRCNDPCGHLRCPEGHRCGVDLYQDESGKVLARGMCREGIVSCFKIKP